jgi:hypothetical protein
MVCFITTVIDIFNEQPFPNDSGLNYTPDSAIKLGQRIVLIFSLYFSSI